LKRVHEGEINSIYDLALIIMNQCSTVFFDRTKLVHERPEVFDIFANAIGYVVSRRRKTDFWDADSLDSQGRKPPLLKLSGIISKTTNSLTPKRKTSGAQRESISISILRGSLCEKPMI
jgi:hypothetical protein